MQCLWKMWLPVTPQYYIFAYSWRGELCYFHFHTTRDIWTFWAEEHARHVKIPHNRDSVACKDAIEQFKGGVHARRKTGSPAGTSSMHTGHLLCPAFASTCDRGVSTSLPARHHSNSILRVRSHPSTLAYSSRFVCVILVVVVAVYVYVCVWVGGVCVGGEGHGRRGLPCWHYQPTKALNRCSDAAGVGVPRTRLGMGPCVGCWRPSLVGVRNRANVG